MATVNILTSAIRVIGGISIMAALAFSTGTAAAGNPIKVGFVECDSGQCITATRTMAQADGGSMHSLTGKLGPRLLDESTPAVTLRRTNAGGVLGPHLEP